MQIYPKANDYASILKVLFTTMTNHNLCYAKRITTLPSHFAFGQAYLSADCTAIVGDGDMCVAKDHGLMASPTSSRAVVLEYFTMCL